MFNMDDYLHPKEEIVTDPIEAEKLGVTPLTAHNIMVKGTGLSLADYLYKVHTLIWNLQAKANGNTVILTWEGDPNVDIIVDENYDVTDKEKHPNGRLSHTLVLPRGKHTFKVTAWKSIFPLYTSVMVEGTTDEIYGDCVITPYNIGMHSFWVRLTGCADLWVSQDGGERRKAISPMPISNLSPNQTVELCFYTEDGVLVKCINVTTDDIPNEIKAYNEGKPPVITSLSDMSYSDTTPAQTILGKFTFDDMGLPITGVRIIGDNDNFFTATVDGNIYLNEKADPTMPSKVWKLVLEVTNAKGSDTQSFIVTYTSLAPSFQDNFMITLKENTPAGTVIANMPIDDKGKPPITVDILDNTIDYYLTINPNGDIVVDNPMDFENPPTGFLPDATDPTNRLIQANIPIKVSNAIASIVGNITITLLNEQDTPPLWTVSGVTITSITENNTVGDTIIDLSSKVSSPIAPIIGYSIDDTTNFTIDNNGVIKANKSFDYETTTSYTLNVTATNKFGTSLPHQVVVKIIDEVVEKPPKFTTTTATMSILENNTIGVTITDVSTLLDPNIPVSSYTIDDTTNFTIDSTGHLKANVVFDYETKTSYVVNITASNAKGASNPLTLTVNILDDQTGKEAPPVFAQSNITLAKIYPNLNTGDVFSTQKAGVDGYYTYSITGSDFNIDPNTGVVTHKAYPDVASIPAPMSATVTATNKDTGATASYTLTVNRLCLNLVNKDYTVDIDLKSSYTAGEVLIPASAVLPSLADCPITGYRLKSPTPFATTGATLDATSNGIIVKTAYTTTEPYAVLKEADFAVNDTPPTDGTWTLPSLQFDANGGMNDYVHTKAVIQVEVKGQWYDISTITIRLRNEVYAGNIEDIIVSKTTDLSLLNTKGKDIAITSNTSIDNTLHDYSIARWNTKSSKVIYQPINMGTFWKGSRATDLNYWNISSASIISVENLYRGMVNAGNDPISNASRADAWESQFQAMGKPIYADLFAGYVKNLATLNLIPKLTNGIILTEERYAASRLGGTSRAYADMKAMIDFRVANGKQVALGMRLNQRPNTLRRLWVNQNDTFQSGSTDIVADTIGLWQTSGNDFIVEMLITYGYGWYIDDALNPQWDGGAPQIVAFVPSPDSRFDISPYFKSIDTSTPGELKLIFDKAQIDANKPAGAENFLGLRLKNTFGEAIYPYDWRATPAKAYDYYDVFKRYTYTL